MQSNKHTLAVAVAMIVGLTACGNQSKDEQNATNARAKADAAEQMEEVMVTAAKSKREQSARKVAQHHMVYSPAMLSTPAMDYYQEPQVDRENYDSLSENPIKLVNKEPVSTFSVDVDTAAYSNIRRILDRDARLPRKDAVKVEEMINYFNYNYPIPKSQATPFSVTTEMAAAPWNPQKQLLMVGLKGYEPQLENRPAANLVFLVDVSGSMQSNDKLPLLKKSLRLLVNKMTAEDTIALAVYAGAAGTVLPATPGNQKAKILAAIDNLRAGGSTNGGAGIQLAYNLAQQSFNKGGINRVIIASDGDMNVGMTSQDKLKELIETKRKTGIALSTLGFGSGNYNYALMEQLADVGNGHAAYIDSLKEAHKVLVEEMQSTLLTIAHDVKIQVEFNPQWVSEYRLIGYENRMLKNEDFNNDKVDAGDIGAGHTVTALYELVIKGSGAEQLPQLRYQQAQGETKKKSNELAFVKLRYKPKQGAKSIELRRAIQADSNKPLKAASENLRFAAAVAGFGQLLRGGKYTADWDYQDALLLAKAARGKDEHGYRAEMLGLLKLADSLSIQNNHNVQNIKQADNH